MNRETVIHRMGGLVRYRPSTGLLLYGTTKSSNVAKAGRDSE
jgi:hypothetical protein